MNTPRPIAGFPAYRIFPDGRIETRWRWGAFYPGMPANDVWKPLVPRVDPQSGYHAVNLREPGRPARRTHVHRLMCESFHGAPPFPKAEARHLDGDTDNNRWDNFAWGTAIENAADKARHGRAGGGRRSGKLNPAMVVIIQERAARGERHRDIADDMGVSRPAISRAVSGKTWS